MSVAPEAPSRIERLSPARRALLAQRVRGASTIAAEATEAGSHIPRLPDGVSPPPSFAQERLWFMEQLSPGTAAYTIPLAVRLRGPLDVAALRVALEAVPARHDSLRMYFPATDDGRPVVAVADRVEVPLRLAAVASVDEAKALLAEYAAVPFDLAEPPLLRAALIRLSASDHVLQVAIHHIVSDGWSAGLLLGEVATLYAAQLGGTQPPPAPPIRYGDYAAWQQDRVTGPNAAAELAHWRATLTGVAPLELPTDRPRPAEQRFDGAGFYFRLDAELVGRLREFARQRGVTLYMTLLAGLQAVLYYHSGQTDFAVGSPVAGRVRPEFEGVIGLFVNMLTLRADLSGGPSFATVLTRTRDCVVDALAHQELPFDRLVQELNLVRDVSRSPLFQVMFALQNYAGAGRSWPDGIVAAPFGGLTRTTRYDLSLYLHETADGLIGECTYRTDLFDDATVRRFTDRYQRLLGAAIAEPDADLAGLEPFEPAERAAVLNFGIAVAPPSSHLASSDPTGSHLASSDPTGPHLASSDPTGPHLASSARTLSDLVRPHVAASPHAPAVVCGERSLTYRELDRRANRLAHYLRGSGVGPETRVGICLEQSVDLAVAVLGVLRSGAAYLPLDPEQPPARLALMLADAAPRMVLTTAALAGRLTGDLRCLDLIGHEIDAQSAAPIHGGAHPGNLAYVIYTSGSTGRPKGVAVAHQQILRYLVGIGSRLDVVAGARYALLQSLSFDFSITVFWLALATGGCVHLVPRRCTGAELAEYLHHHRIDYLKMTPTHLAALAADVEPGALLPARALLLGGEAASLAWTTELASLAAQSKPAQSNPAQSNPAQSNPAVVVNHYGPTETTVGVTTYLVPPAGREPRPSADTAAGSVAAASVATPIGVPLPDARVYVLDGRLRPVPIGLPGEIYIGGDRLARGYLGQPGLTAERFVPDPFVQAPFVQDGDGPTRAGGRMYRTGDMGRWRSDGQLEFLGRRDQQIKIRGFRVELGEVEAALASCPGVVQAVVVLRADQLIGYLERAAGADEVPTAELRRMLGERLPDYMVPSRLVWLDRLPLQDHGKVDRGALPEPPAHERPEDAYVAPEGPIETTIAAVFQTVLGLGKVGATEDFFELGGHSLLATQVVARLRRCLSTDVQPAARPVSVMDLFKYRTVRALAALTTDDVVGGGLLHELTRPLRPGQQRVRSYVCVPYGGASAVVYQPLADALPLGHTLHAVAVPGHDIGLAERPEPLEVVAQRCVEEILSLVDGSLVLYGHCGPGGALTVEIARLLESAGRSIEAVYLGGIFPFARPVGGLLGWLTRLRLGERLRGDRVYANWLQSMGAEVGALDPNQMKFLVRTMRHDAEVAEEYFTTLLNQQVARLAAPVISVIGERDPTTEYYQERYREWHFLSPIAGLVILDEAGHYFLKYRAEELATIVTTVDHRLTEPVPPADPDASWWLADVSVDNAPAAGPAPAAPSTAASPDTAPLTAAPPDTAPSKAASPDTALPAIPAPETTGPRPSMRRFMAIAIGQIVSVTGSSLTGFAVPLWIFLTTGSLVRFALFAVLGLVPGMLVAPVAGAIVDRSDRRRVMLAGNTAAGAAVFVIAALQWTDSLQTWHLYVLVSWLSAATTFQRLAYFSAIPQLVPKRYLGHANGVAQLAGGIANFLVPLVAVALMATIKLGGILTIDVVSYGVTIAVLLTVRFPRTMARRRRESLAAEIAGGVRYSVRHRGFRGMLTFFAVLNIFLSPLFLLLSPLVLAFAPLAAVGRVAMAGGAGAITGALTMMVWGGPRHGRMRGVLIATLGFAGACVVTGLRPSLVVICAGAFGMSLMLTIVNGTYATIIQTKVPQRLHGRVIALNTVVAWSTLPIGWAVVAPLAVPVMEPLLRPGGALAPTVGAVIGIGPGRGVALLYIVLALCITVVVSVAMRVPVLARFDDDVPDAPPDDLFGLEARRARVAAAGSAKAGSAKAGPAKAGPAGTRLAGAGPAGAGAGE